MPREGNDPLRALPIGSVEALASPNPLFTDARRIFRAALKAVEPGRAVARVIHRRGARVSVGPVIWRLRQPARVRVVAIGKAASRMFDVARNELGPYAEEGLVVIPRFTTPPREEAEVRFGEHPVPGRGSLAAGRAALEYVARVDSRDHLLFLISGGGSALCEAPAAGLSLGDLARTGQILLASGAPIQEMNAVRRHLSAVKGGRLALRSGTRDFVTLAISDVVGDSPQDIASGPTAVDPSTYQDALNSIRRRGVGNRVGARVMGHLVAGRQGDFAETAKPGDRRFSPERFQVIARNADAVGAAGREASRLGFHARNLGSAITGDTALAARRQARRLVAAVRHRSFPNPPVCFVSGGETTVTLSAGSGKGGRNQEFALACAAIIAGTPLVLALSVGTDGVDGPTDAAGGWTDGDTLLRARLGGLSVESALRRHDSYPILDRLGQLIRTGPTGTNVTDLHVLLAGRPGGRGGSSPRSGARRNRRRRSSAAGSP